MSVEYLGRKRFSALSASGWYKFVGRGLTFCWVAFTLLWFWSDWPELAHYARAVTIPFLLFGWVTLITIACVLLGLLMELQKRVFDAGPIALALRSRYAQAAFMTLMVVAILGVQSVNQSAPPDVVYKEF